jgi:hydrogenase maturation protease
MNALIQTPTLRALIIGYGNPLRGDDALGVRVADCLAAIPTIAGDPMVQIETVHQLTPDVAGIIADAGMVLFIDVTAPSPGLPPGTVHYEEIEASSASAEALGHHLTPAQVLAYASAVFGARPRAYVATVTAETFDYGAPLSPPVEAAVPVLVQWACALVE